MRRERIDLLRSTLVDALSGHCAKCGLADADDLEIDHVDGITWDRYAVGREQRIRRYVEEYRAGVRLQLLCQHCHPRGRASAVAWEHFEAWRAGTVPTPSPLAIGHAGPVRSISPLTIRRSGGETGRRSGLKTS